MTELPSSDAAPLPQAVARLAERGLPLAEGLRAYASELPRPRARSRLLRVADEIELGASLAEAIAKHGQRGDAFWEALATGVASHRLTEVLHEYLRCLRRQEQLRKKAWVIWLYPLALILATTLLCGFAMTMIIPQFKDIFIDFGVELPGVTMFLIVISDWFVFILPTLIGLTIALALIIVFRRLLPFYSEATVLVSKIPLFGTALQVGGAAEWCSWMALMVEGRTPMPQALEATATAMRDQTISSASREMATDVSQGRSLATAAANAFGFPKQLRQVCRWESRSDAFAEILRETSTLLAMQVQNRLNLLATVITIVMLVGAALTTGFVVISLFLPLIKLLNELS